MSVIVLFNSPVILLKQGAFVFWTIISMAYGLFHSFEPFLRPKPVPCGLQTCLYFISYIHNKSGLIANNLFDLSPGDNGESIIFWLVESKFLAYHNNIIYFLGESSAFSNSLLTIQDRFAPTIEPDYRLVILGSDIFITYRFIDGNKPSLSLNAVDLIKRYKLDLNNKQLQHLDSISFAADVFSNLDRFIISYGTTISNYSYIGGSRTLNGRHQMFVARLCTKFTLNSFTEIWISDNYLKSDGFIHSLVIESDEIQKRRLLNAYLVGDKLIVLPMHFSKFNEARRKCVSGTGPSLGSTLSSTAIFPDCSANSETNNSNTNNFDFCNANLPVVPSIDEGYTFSYWSSDRPIALNFVYITFPVHAYVVVKVNTDYSVQKCFIQTAPFFPDEWPCDLLGNIAPFSSLSNTSFPPFFNPNEGTVEVYSPNLNSMVSHKIMKCAYLTNCLSCLLLGQYFHCGWVIAIFESSCQSNNNLTNPEEFNAQNVDKIITIERCLKLVSVFPDLIILNNPIVQFTVLIDFYESLPETAVLKGYEFIVFVDGNPCVSTTQSIVFQSLKRSFSLTCNLGKRKRGTWPVTFSVGSNENVKFAPKFITSNQYLNITIDGVPTVSNSNRETRNYVTIFTRIFFALILLFILSLSLKTRVKTPNGSTKVTEKTSTKHNQTGAPRNKSLP